MAIHARSDVVSVTLPASHGGCGQPHHRPVRDGAPVKLWALECSSCEDVLRHDPLWSVNPAQLAETPDERTLREDKEKRSVVEQQNATLEALEQLSKLGELPSVMAQFIQFMASQSSRPLAPEPGFRAPMPQRDWHAVTAKAEAPAEAPASEAPPEEVAEATAAAQEGSEPDFTEMTVPQLRQLARDRGITIPVDKRDRQSVIELLSQEG